MIVLSLLGSILIVIYTIFCSILSVIAAYLDPSGRAYLWVGRIWSRGILLCLGVRLKVTGKENLRHGGAVYVSNHSSFMDIPVLLVAIRDNIRLTYRNTLTRTPIWGWALRIGHFLMIDRSSPQQARRTIERAKKLLARGASIQLFPEGTRSPNGEMQSFKRGAFSLAYDARAAIVPFAMIGTFPILPRNRTLPVWGCKVEVRVGKAIMPREVPEAESRAEEVRLMKEAEAAVRDLLHL